MSQVTLQGNASGTGIFTLAAPNSNTNRTLNLPDAAGDVVLTTATQTLTNKSISGAQINSGTVAVARLGSGTPGTGNFLRGDGSWQAVPASAPTTAQVLSAYAGGAFNAVGTHRFAFYDQTPLSEAQWRPGTNQAGSRLFQMQDAFTPAGTQTLGEYMMSTGTTETSANNIIRQFNFPGTWRYLGHHAIGRSGRRPCGLFVRIS
jgi:hypothetical protein